MRDNISESSINGREGENNTLINKQKVNMSMRGGQNHIEKGMVELFKVELREEVAFQVGGMNTEDGERKLSLSEVAVQNKCRKGAVQAIKKGTWKRKARKK